MHLWATRCDRAVSDIFAVQDGITDNMSGAIEPQHYLAENQGVQPGLRLRHAGHSPCLGLVPGSSYAYGGRPKRHAPPIVLRQSRNRNLDGLRRAGLT